MTPHRPALGDIEIRPATSADAAAMGRVHTRGWQVAYRGLMPQPFLDAIDPARRAAGWERTIAEAPPRQITLVAVRDRSVVGFANVGPSRDKDAQDGDGEVRAIYVDPERWGIGAGRALMVAGLAALRDAGFEDAVLWVLIDNERARRFYETGGWSADGATTQDDGLGFRITEIRYRRPLP